MLLVFLTIFMAGSGVVVIALIVYMDKKNISERKAGISNKNKGMKLLKLFEFYNKFFLTRGGIQKVYSRVSELSVYTGLEGRCVAVKFYTMSLTVLLGICIGGAVIFKDLFSTLLVVMFAFVMKVTLVDKQIDKIHFKLLKQLMHALSSVRQNYLSLGNIPDSVAEAETGPLLRRAFDDIYMILTATESEKRLEEFFAATPFRLVQTLACVCYQINNSGDSKLGDGTSNFLQAMSMMENEVQMEVHRLTLQKSKFGLLEILPLAPLAAIKGIEVFFTSTIPGTTVIYNGPIGYISKVVIILSAMLGYTVIVKINSAVPIKKDDRSSIALTLLGYKWFNDLIDGVVPKKAKRALKKTKALRGALSMVDIRHLYSKKIICAFTALVVSSFFLVFALDLGREFIYKNTAEASLVAGTALSKEDVILRQRMDVIYMQSPTLPTEKETAVFVAKYLPKLEEYDRQAQIHRLQVKYRTYYATFFKWWMLLISYGIGLLAWIFPEMGLKARAWLLKTESEEDVLQMQTLIAILMNTSIDTMDTLFWMWKQSRVHSRVLLAAYHEYPSDPEMALNRLKAKAGLPEFKNLVDKLKLTIHQITLAEAFSDLVSDRSHILAIRKIAQTNTLLKKRALASPLAKAPLYLTAFAYILLPLGILGFQEFLSAFKNLNL